MDNEQIIDAVKSCVANVEDAFDEFKSSNDARIDAIDKHLARVEAKMGRPGATADDVCTGKDSPEFKTFTKFVRQGKEALDSTEFKSLQVAVDTTGGYLAPAEFSVEVDKDVVQFSPVRLAARVGQTSAGSVKVPRRTGKPTASWVGETETRTETQSAYGQVEIQIDEMACYVDVSNKLLEDAAVDIAAEVAFDLAEEFGRLEGLAFVSGNGIKKPEGFLSYSGIGFTPSGAAAAMTSDSLIDLFYALAPFYRQRGTWMCNGTSLATIRKLKSGDGQYLWQPAIAAGQPETILGRPVVEAVDMPDVASGAYPVAFGDFASAYRIYDRVGISLIRDHLTQATSGLTRFHARRRVGGGVVRAEAVRKLKIASS